MAALTEQDFALAADRALEQAQRVLLPLADEKEFEVELQNGVLQVVFEEPTDAKFIVQPERPCPANLGVRPLAQLQAVVG